MGRRERLRGRLPRLPYGRLAMTLVRFIPLWVRAFCVESMDQTDQTNQMNQNYTVIKGSGIWVGILAEGNLLKKVFLAGNREDILSKFCRNECVSRGKINGFNAARSRPINSSSVLDHITDDLIRYLSGDKVDFSEYPLHMSLSAVASRMLTEVRRIPYGQVRTYKWVAHRLGTRGYRAVGRVLSKNPFPILIPCHRVIRTDGTLGGFSAGLEIKKKLLNMEGIKIA